MNTIRWTASAEDSYLVFLRAAYDYNTETAVALDDQLENLLNRLRQFKHLCPPLQTVAGLRRCLINARIALVHDVSGTEITIISVFDTRSTHPFN